MAIILFDQPDTNWQELSGAFPSGLIDTHPGGKYVALQVQLFDEVTTERAAILNSKTRKIFWNPGNANALCWIEQCSEMLILEKVYTEGSVRPPIYATPTQEEYQHFMRRVSWPGLETISCIELKFPMGWLIDVVASPIDKLACFVWQDQCESGIEFVTWTEGKLRQIPNIGFFMDSNLIRGPVFSPDGSILAMTFGGGIWWADEPEKFSSGGVKKVGSVVWSETGSGRYYRSDLQTEVPDGWRPEDPNDILKNEFLPLPEFITPKEISIVIPTGEKKLIYL